MSPPSVEQLHEIITSFNPKHFVMGPMYQSARGLKVTGAICAYLTVWDDQARSLKLCKAIITYYYFFGQYTKQSDDSKSWEMGIDDLNSQKNSKERLELGG